MKIKFENLPAELLNQKRWFAVKPNKQPITKDWSNPSNQHAFSDINGIAGFDISGHNIAPDYLVLDFDHVLDDNGNFVNQLAHDTFFDILSQSSSYAELSVSNHGLHIILLPSEGSFHSVSNSSDGIFYFSSSTSKNSPKLELFYKTGGRYFLFTGNVFHCPPQQPIAHGSVADTVFSYILNKISSSKKKSTTFSKPIKDKLFSTKEAASFLGVSKSTLEKWRSRRIFNVPFFEPAIKTPNSFYYSLEQLQQLKSVYQKGNLQNIYRAFKRLSKNQPDSLCTQSENNLNNADLLSNNPKSVLNTNALFDMDEVAKILDVSKETLSEWNKQRILEPFLITHEGEFFYTLDDIDEYRQKHDPSFADNNSNSDFQLARIQNALHSIDPSSISYDDWLNVGKALKSHGCDISLWDDWSKLDSDRYKGFDEISYKWNSFNGSGITIASLFKLSHDHGFDEKAFFQEWHSSHSPVAPPSYSFPDPSIPSDCPLPNFKLPFSLSADFSNHITLDSDRHIKFHSIMLVSKLFLNLDSRIEKVQISVLKPFSNRWVSFVIERKFIASKTKIVDLSSFGLDVTSSRASYLVNYLDSFEALNSSIIPTVYTVSSTGWRSNLDFVFPNSNSNFDLDDSIKPNLDTIFSSSGDKSAVVDLLISLIHNPIVFAVIGTALAAPLVHIFRCSNIALHIFANTGSGKSTLNKLALSLFANPNCTAALPTINATKAGLEYFFASRRDLPSIIEDIDSSNDDRSKKLIRDLPYQFVNNTGRLRAKKSGGNDILLDFRGSLITNGERPLTSDSSAGGGKRRLIELKADDNIFSASQARLIHSTIKDNFGLFGRDWISYIQSHVDDLRSDFHNHSFSDFGFFTHFPSKIPLHLYSLAAITTSFIHFCVHFLHLDQDTALKYAMASSIHILHSLPDEVEIADSQRAKSFVREWIDMHPKHFMQSTDLSGVNAQAEAYETWGIIRNDSVAIFPTKFKQMLSDFGFSADMVIKQLADDGFIKRDNKGKSTMLVKLEGKPIRMVVIGKANLYGEK